MNQFSHTDEKGKAKMVDVTEKVISFRTAIAEGKIWLQPETIRLISENLINKGDVLSVARIAGIQAAKQTSILIPLCHPLNITSITMNFTINADNIIATAETKCCGQTGVEMEALTAASIALLTIYDMCKAVDKTMQIDNIHLISKTKTPC